MCEETKVCKKCGEEKPLSEFNHNCLYDDGHRTDCKECQKEYNKTHYAKMREYYSRYEQDRYQRPERKRYMQEQHKKHNIRNPQKAKARRIISNAIRSGKLQRKPCEFCGNPKSQAHHEDYSKPLDVVWVCFKCHRERFHNQLVTAEV